MSKALWNAAIIGVVSVLGLWEEGCHRYNIKNTFTLGGCNQQHVPPCTFPSFSECSLQLDKGGSHHGTWRSRCGQSRMAAGTALLFRRGSSRAEQVRCRAAAPFLFANPQLAQLFQLLMFYIHCCPKPGGRKHVLKRLWWREKNVRYILRSWKYQQISVDLEMLRHLYLYSLHKCLKPL